MVSETRLAERCGVPTVTPRRATRGFLVSRLAAGAMGFILLGLACAPTSGSCQAPTSDSSQSHFTTAILPNSPGPDTDPILALEGLTVVSISFKGIPDDRLAPLPGHLAQAEGAALTADNVKRSLRQLYCKRAL